jgi:hypothetical protein
MGVVTTGLPLLLSAPPMTHDSRPVTILLATPPVMADGLLLRKMNAQNWWTGEHCVAVTPTLSRGT